MVSFAMNFSITHFVFRTKRERADAHWGFVRRYAFALRNGWTFPAAFFVSVLGRKEM
jgi:hypothetical protein